MILCQFSPLGPPRNSFPSLWGRPFTASWLNWELPSTTGNFIGQEYAHCVNASWGPLLFYGGIPKLNPMIQFGTMLKAHFKSRTVYRISRILHCHFIVWQHPPLSNPAFFTSLQVCISRALHNKDSACNPPLQGLFQETCLTQWWIEWS